MTAPARFCTYFDHRYLPRGLALYSSMVRHCQPFELFVLCMTEECYRILDSFALRGVIPLRLDELEAHDADLCNVKNHRSLIEYYFTCGPALIAWLLERDPSIEVLTYLDADLYFFQSPKPIFDAFENFSTLIVPHNFSRGNEQQRVFGLYNVGWVCFRADAEGLACLRWWRRSCIEWCRDIPEDGRYADQKYLEQFPKRFARVQITRHPGVNLAPWNIDNYRFSVGSDNEPRVEDVPVIFFHFHGLRRIASFLWCTHHIYGAAPNRRMRASLYAPYLAVLEAFEALVRDRLPTLPAPLGRHRTRTGLNVVFALSREVVGALLRGGAMWSSGNGLSSESLIMSLPKRDLENPGAGASDSPARRPHGHATGA